MPILGLGWRLGEEGCGRSPAEPPGGLQSGWERWAHRHHKQGEKGRIRKILEGAVLLAF